jgi:2-phosphosulfolactate phosphatase
MPVALDVDVVLLPCDLEPRHRVGRSVVVFDVLRATSSMTAALAAGVSRIEVFPDSASALRAAATAPPGRILCGEENCLPPPGFDLGNSPRAFNAPQHAGRIVLMSTTNGTRALLAAVGAEHICTGALVNASAVARTLVGAKRPITLLCAGTNHTVAMEDVLGAGAVIHALKRHGDVSLTSDVALMADRLFAASSHELPAVLRNTRGGKNIIAAGLADDIDFCARLDAFDVVGIAAGEPLCVIRAPLFS